jgi:hypothetical protein
MAVDAPTRLGRYCAPSWDLLLLGRAVLRCSSNRELLPHVPDAWMDHTKTPIGGEIPFTRHFCRLQPRRLLEEIRGDLKTLQAEVEGLFDQVYDWPKVEKRIVKQLADRSDNLTVRGNLTQRASGPYANRDPSISHW